MNCPVCGSDKTTFHANIDRFSPPLSIHKCTDCESLFQHPLPQNPDEFYNSDYYSGKADYSYIDEREQYPYFAHVYCSRLRNIRRFVKTGRFLDIGSAFGGLVRCASRTFEAYGLDVSPFAVEKGNEWLGRTNHPALFHGSPEKLPEDPRFPQKNYDVITMIEVAEHLENPQKIFNTIFDMLNPGGMLVIQTANFSGWQAIQAGNDYHYFLPGHLVYYTSEGLKRLLEKKGFTAFREFIPVDFSLFAKLAKARGNFRTWKDYGKWWSIAQYHIKSSFHRKGKPLTSSYVLYAFKQGEKNERQ